MDTVAPDAVLTVRKQVRRLLYGPGLVRKSASANTRTSMSERNAIRQTILGPSRGLQPGGARCGLTCRLAVRAAAGCG